MPTDPPRPGAVHLPVQLSDGSSAVVTELSPTRLYIEAQACRPIVGPLVFEMHLPRTRWRFTAIGDVVDVVPLGAKCGITVRLRELRMHPVE